MDQPIIAWGGEQRNSTNSTNEVDITTIKNLINSDGFKKAVVNIRTENPVGFEIAPFNNIVGDGLAVFVSWLVADNPYLGNFTPEQINEAITTGLPVRFTSKKFHFDLQDLTSNETSTTTLDLNNQNSSARILQLIQLWYSVRPFIFPGKKPLLEEDFTDWRTSIRRMGLYIDKMTGHDYDASTDEKLTLTQTPTRFPLYNDISIVNDSNNSLKKLIQFKSWKQVNNSNEIITLPYNSDYSNIFFGNSEQVNLNYDTTFLNFRMKNSGGSYITPLKIDGSSNVYALSNLYSCNVIASSNVMSDRIRVSQVGVGTAFSEFTYDGTRVISTKPLQTSAVRLDGASNGVCDLSQTSTGLTISTGAVFNGHVTMSNLVLKNGNNSTTIINSGSNVTFSNEVQVDRLRIKGNNSNGTIDFNTSNVLVASHPVEVQKLTVDGATNGKVDITQTASGLTFSSNVLINGTLSTTSNLLPFRIGCGTTTPIDGIEIAGPKILKCTNSNGTNKTLIVEGANNKVGIGSDPSATNSNILQVIGSADFSGTLQCQSLKIQPNTPANAPGALIQPSGSNGIFMNATGGVAVSGACNASRLVVTDSNGKLDTSTDIPATLIPFGPVSSDARALVTSSKLSFNSNNGRITCDQLDVKSLVANRVPYYANNLTVGDGTRLADTSNLTFDGSILYAKDLKTQSDGTNRVPYVDSNGDFKYDANFTFNPLTNTLIVNKLDTVIGANRLVRTDATGILSAGPSFNLLGLIDGNSIEKATNLTYGVVKTDLLDDKVKQAGDKASDAASSASAAASSASAAAASASSAASATSSGIAAGLSGGGAIASFVGNAISAGDFCTNSKADTINDRQKVYYSYGASGTKYVAYMVQGWMDSKYLLAENGGNTDGCRDFRNKIFDTVDDRLLNGTVGIGTSATSNALTVYGNTTFISDAPKIVTLPMVPIGNSTASLPPPFNGTYTANQSSSFSGGNNATSAFRLDGVTTWWRGTGIYNNRDYTNNGDGTVKSTSNVDGTNTINGEYIGLILPNIPFVLTGYSIRCLSARGDSPRSWTILGTNDNGTTWTTLDVKDNETTDTITYSSITGPRLPFTRFRFIVRQIRTTAATISAPILGEWTLNGFVSTYKEPRVAASITGAINPEDSTEFNVFGGVTIGATYGGCNVATNNMIVEGNVGIGTTSPTQKLDVVGTVKATSFIGDGSGLTNISIPSTFTNGTFSGTVTASNFVGNGSTLTGLVASNIPTTLNATTFNGDVTASNFIGGGSGITGITASQIPSTLNATTFSGAVTATNFIGNGSLITNIAASNLPATMNATTFTGSVTATNFIGNGSLITNIAASNLPATMNATTFTSSVTTPTLNVSNATVSNTLTLGNLVLTSGNFNTINVTGTSGGFSNVTASNIAIGSTDNTKARLYMNYPSGAGANALPLFLIEDATAPDSSPYVITSNGSVGIGITNPTQKLYVNGISYLNGNTTVNGTLTTTSTISAPSITNATGAISMSNATFSNITSSTLITGNSANFSGRIGIGTTTIPVGRSEPLYVNGNSYFNGTFTGNSSATFCNIYAGFSVATQAINTSNLLASAWISTPDLTVTNNSSLVNVTATGNVVIGTPPFSSGKKFHVEGTAIFTDSTDVNGTLTTNGFLNINNQLNAYSYSYFNGVTTFNGLAQGKNFVNTRGLTASTVVMTGYTFLYSTFGVDNNKLTATGSTSEMSYTVLSPVTLTSYTLTGSLSDFTGTRIFTITPSTTYRYIRAYYWENITGYNNMGPFLTDMMVFTIRHPGSAVQVYLNDHRLYASSGTAAVVQMIVPINGQFSLNVFVGVGDTQPVKIEYYLFK